MKWRKAQVETLTMRKSSGEKEVMTAKGEQKEKTVTCVSPTDTKRPDC